jgi:2-polyprenyl-3-methyl-5-hydroxy-6-metoxy-1,4-benzoquinol methylase
MSWYQIEPTVSLGLLAEAGIVPGSHVIDVGGGASTLVDRLLDLGVVVTVLDVAETALKIAAERLEDRAARVTWIVHDLLTWKPGQQYDVWHDRAVFHFLTEASDRDRYRDILDKALPQGGRVVVGTFAEDGPEACSGLPVARYSPEALAMEFHGYQVLARRREKHRTPWDSVQPFTWLLLRRT